MCDTLTEKLIVKTDFGKLFLAGKRRRNSSNLLGIVTVPVEETLIRAKSRHFELDRLQVLELLFSFFDRFD